LLEYTHMLFVVVFNSDSFDRFTLESDEILTILDPTENAADSVPIVNCGAETDDHILARFDLVSCGHQFSSQNVQRDATRRGQRAPEHRLGWHVPHDFQLRSGGGLDILVLLAACFKCVWGNDMVNGKHDVLIASWLDLANSIILQEHVECEKDSADAVSLDARSNE
jgi:hypothetical protein